MAVSDVILLKKKIPTKANDFFKKNNSNTKAKRSKIPGDAVLLQPP